MADQAWVGSVVVELRRRAGDRAAGLSVDEREAMDQAAHHLLEAFSLSETEATAAAEAVTREPLPRVFDAGARALRAAPRDAPAGDAAPSASPEAHATDDDLERDPLFQRYLATVREKGVFAGAAEGSEAHAALYARVKHKFRERMQKKAPVAAGGAAAADKAPAAAAAADAKKAAGNAALAAGKVDEAVERYGEAIALCPDGPNSHVFYANRAAALMRMKAYDRAVSDCEASVALCPTYTKGHVRLGNALYYQGSLEPAIAAYEKALSIDPGNESAREQLQAARRRLEKQRERAAPPPAAAAAPPSAPSAPSGAGTPPGMPDMSQLMNNPMLSGLMSNPAIMGMAQQMMSDPNAMSQLMGMMGGGGGAGGMPDLSSLMGAASAASPAAASAGSADAGDAPAAAPAGDNPLAGLSALKDAPEMASYRSDPRLADFFADLETGGPMAAMRHMGNPAVMEMINAMAQRLGGSGGDGDGDADGDGEDDA